MNKPLFTGVCTALVTPFLGGNVNYPMMDLLLRRQMQAGIQAVVLCGTTGEAPTLTDLEKLAMFRRSGTYPGDCVQCTLPHGGGYPCQRLPKSGPDPQYRRGQGSQW